MKQHLLLLSTIILSASSLWCQWTPLCTGAGNNNGFVVDFEYHNDTLYATGLFTKLCGETTGPFAKQDGDDWVLGGAIPRDGHALEVIDDALHIATYQFDTDSNYVFRNNDGFVSSLGDGVYYDGFEMTPTIYDIIEYEGQIIASGDFNKVGNKFISGIMRWTGTEWDSLGSGLTGNLPGAPPILYPHNMHVYDGDLYVAGNFESAGGIIVNGIARWDGTQWYEIGAGFDQAAYCVGSYDGALYAGGQFSESDGVSLAAFARWNGSEWESPGFGFSSAVSSDFTFAHTLKVYDDKLYIAGGFDEVILDDGTVIPCGSVIAWDGDSIYTFGGGVSDKDIEAIAITDDGFLFGGGVFGEGYIAEWSEPEEPVSIEDNSSEWSLTLDNAHSLLYVYHSNLTAVEYSLRNFSGQLVMSGDLYYNNIPISNLPAGMYYINILADNGQRAVKVFVKP